MFKYRKLNQNALKLIALISMTLDHIGKVLFSFYPDNSAIGIASNILSILGRFSLPIFIFLIFEGFEHTKDIGKYFLLRSM